MLFMVGQGGWIITCETSVAILRLVWMARIFTKRPIQAVDGQEGEAVSLNKLPHFFYIHAAGKQLGTLGCVDAVKATVYRRRASDAHMHLGGPSLAHHLHDLKRSCPTHDRIVD